MNYFKKLFQEHYQSVKQFESRLVLIWVQTVCKSYQKMTKEASKERVKPLKRQEKNASENVVCGSRLLQIIA